MFKQRLMTGLLLAPLVLLAIVYSHWQLFSLLVGGLLLLASWEWTRLVPLEGRAMRLLVCSVIAAVLVLSFWDRSAYWWLSALISWLCLFVIILSYPRGKVILSTRLSVLALAVLLLPACFLSIVQLKMVDGHGGWLIYCLFLIWSADTGAYFVGKMYGKHKLLPAVSPGKTVEGVCGGIFLSMVTALVGAYCFSIPSEMYVKWFVLAFFTAVVSVFGDLFISVLKRRVSLKDTGSILPGHGGILDRIDSLLAASTFFVFIAGSWQLI